MFKNKKRIIIIFTFLVIFIFLSLPLPISRNIKTSITNIFSPVLRVVSGIGHKIAQIWDVTFHSTNIVSESEKHKSKIKELEAENVKLKEEIRTLKSFNEQLAELEGSGFTLVPARIIGRDPDVWHRTIIINRGSKSKIGSGMPVVYGKNLVGRIIEVKPRWSRVRLIFDSQSRIPGLIQKLRTKVLVETSAFNQLKIEYMEEEPKEGSIVITSQLSLSPEEEKIFPQGFTIGKIISKKKEQASWSAILEPTIDFKTLEEVFVVIVE